MIISITILLIAMFFGGVIGRCRRTEQCYPSSYRTLEKALAIKEIKPTQTNRKAPHRQEQKLHHERVSVTREIMMCWAHGKGRAVVI